jgi:hypothetical protein
MMVMAHGEDGKAIRRGFSKQGLFRCVATKTRVTLTTLKAEKSNAKNSYLLN